MLNIHFSVIVKHQHTVIWKNSHGITIGHELFLPHTGNSSLVRQSWPVERVNRKRGKWWLLPVSPQFLSVPQIYKVGGREVRNRRTASYTVVCLYLASIFKQLYRKKNQITLKKHCSILTTGWTCCSNQRGVPVWIGFESKAKRIHRWDSCKDEAKERVRGDSKIFNSSKKLGSWRHSLIHSTNIYWVPTTSQALVRD